MSSGVFAWQQLAFAVPSFVRRIAPVRFTARVRLRPRPHPVPARACGSLRAAASGRALAAPQPVAFHASRRHRKSNPPPGEQPMTTKTPSSSAHRRATPWFSLDGVPPYLPPQAGPRKSVLIKEVPKRMPTTRPAWHSTRPCNDRPGPGTRLSSRATPKAKPPLDSRPWQQLSAQSSLPRSQPAHGLCSSPSAEHLSTHPVPVIEH